MWEKKECLLEWQRGVGGKRDSRQEWGLEHDLTSLPIHTHTVSFYTLPNALHMSVIFTV